MSPVRRAVVTRGVMLGMLKQLLDTTIANIALPHMQASLANLATLYTTIGGDSLEPGTLARC